MTKVDLKIVLLGQQHVGKSCLVDRFLNSKFDAQQKNTIGAAFGAKRVYLPNGRGMTLGIWDTAGAERFESLSRVYYHSAGSALVCFDPTKIDTWHKLDFWVGELQENEPRCKIYLVETKQDLLEAGHKRAVAEEEVIAYAERMDAQVYRTSAKTGYNVVDLFVGVARDADSEMMAARMQNNTNFVSPTASADLSKKAPAPNNCCATT